MTALHKILFRRGINVLTGLWLDNVQVTASAAEINALDITAAGTAQASKAVVADANIDVAGLRNITATGTATVGAVAANDAALDIAGKAASVAGNGGAVALVAGQAHTNGVGGAISVTAGAGSATGTGAGGEASLVAGASGGGATGNGGEVKVTGGAAASDDGNGGAATIAGGAATGTGTGGAVTLTGGASAGATGTAGGVTIDAGDPDGGTGAAVSIAPTNATGVSIGKVTTLATDTKLQFRDTGLFINSGADGKLTISSDGVGADDIALSGTVTLNDDVLQAADKKVSFGDTGTYISQLDDGKLTISSDGVGADDIILDGTVTVNDNLTLAADKNILLQGTGKLSIDSTTVNTTAAELNAFDLSAAGGVVKCVKHAIAAAPTGAEQDTTITLPANCIVQDVFLKVTAAEATGATKTMMIGTKSGDGGDADGFGVGLNCASTGLVRPGVTIDGGGAYFDTNTRGALLAKFVQGAGADDRGLYVEFPCTTQGGEVVTFTAGSADWVEFRGTIIIQYVEIA